ncbi:uncharacterized protein N0V89_012149 [Didymosphaeria variabile]|uniref:Cytoskeleton organization protein n=1 Tax=Didymosphaeria variabile TaxID=1932322 RepID=A0A9W8X9W9_9PLEO|nr:uncharacterized protein N0V89_012149 [Didymosphaeria variabile]KAJ4344407.1 hypothetical protein N0V89_012149 [Didymosphaeria variabile]
MAFNWDKFCKAQRDNPRPKFALDAVGKLLKKRPDDPYLLTWKASTLLKFDGRADEALSILISICQRQPPITDPNLLPFIYNRILNASRQSDPNCLTLSSVGAEGLKAWQNAAKALPNRKAKLKLWSDLFVVSMKDECWEDVRWATMQANKESPESKSRKAIYYSLILANQLGGERRAEKAKEADKVDPSAHIQLTIALRQMSEAYGNSSKPTDDVIQVASMSDLRFMAAIYERQNRCAELFQLWDNPTPTVQRIIDGASWDFALLRIEVAHRQNEWQHVETMCYRLIDMIWQSGNPITGDPSAVQAKMFNICLTQLSLESYLGYPTLSTITQFYFECFRNPSCFKDLHRFVALLSVEEQRQFQATISEHAQTLGKNVRGREEGASEEDTKNNIRVWHEAETTVLKFDLLMIVSLPVKPDPVILESFVENALRLWRLQLAAEGTDAMCGSDTLSVAVEALIYLFEATSLSQYLYQAAVLARYALSLDRQQHSRSVALLSTRLHLKLGLGTFAFEHYGRVQIKEMLHDNVAWIALSRISQSHPFGASGPRGFSADDELEKVISTLSRMEKKIDDLLYADLQHFMYDKAFDLLELKRKLRTSLTKHFCIIERRRIARLAGAPVDPTLDLPLRDHEDISDNCHWDAVPGLNHIRSGGILNTHFVLPITESWVHNFRTLIDVVNGIAFKEVSSGHNSQCQGAPSYVPFMSEYAKEDALPANEEQDSRACLNLTESGLNNSYWKPIACILKTIIPTVKLPAWLQMESLVAAFGRIFNQLEIDTDEVRRQIQEANNADLDCAPNLTEDALNAVYGRLEVLRILVQLLTFMRPISKARTHALHKEITTANCDHLQESISEFCRLHKIRIKAIIDRLKKNGVAHFRTQFHYSKTGAAIAEMIDDETLDIYSKEYADSAIEALNGVLKVQLG